MSREAYLTLATGVKGVGKSYLSFEILYAYSQGVRKNGFYPRKVLIFDVNNEYGVFTADPSDKEGRALFGDKTIYVDALDPYRTSSFTAQKMAEIRRICPIHLYDVKDKKGNILARAGDEWTTDEAVAFLLHVVRNFRGGLLLIEDLSSLFGDQIPRQIMGIITRNRHRDLDIVMHLQSISPILPRFWQNCQWTRFHKQADGVEKSKDKLGEKYTMYKIAEKLVDTQYYAGNERYHVWINNLKAYIQGNFTPEMALAAIREYLSENYAELRGLQNKRNESGVKINNYQTALQQRTEHLYRKFFRTL